MEHIIIEGFDAADAFEFREVGPIGLTPIPDEPWPVVFPPLPVPFPYPGGTCPGMGPVLIDELDLAMDGPAGLPLHVGLF